MEQSAARSRPNVVYIHAHDAGRFVQPYGYPVETPALMRFAKEAVLFRKAFAAAPTCSPSRAALLSGQYPHQCGMYGLTGQGWRLTDYRHHLARVLREEGYHTALAGCQHEAVHSDLSPLGYDEILDGEHAGEFSQDSVTRAEEYIARCADGTGPFFLSFGTDEPHRNNIARPELGIGKESARFSKTRYYDPEKLDWRYTAPLPNLPDLPEIRRDVESLREGVRIMDEYMGRIIGAIDHHGLREQTLVIVTTDHGIEFAGGKKTLGDLGTGVMLMLRGPGAGEGGRVIEPVVEQLDLYPTILELVGAEPRPWAEGTSLLPLLRNETDSVHDYVFTEQTYHGALEPIRAVRSERYKLVRRVRTPAPIMRHDGPTTPLLEEIGWYERSNATTELYDLYLDPQEACDRAGDPHYEAVHRELSSALDSWMERTADPFAVGAFPDPPTD
jgi:N-sulfoglucosamine sulfohydrolase